MPKPSPEALLIIYERALAKYEAEGLIMQASIQKRLIAKLKAACIPLEIQ